MMDSGSNKEVRVRFAPSPTGHWHIGGARTALFNWLFARQNNGKFILRVEDTDKERSKEEHEIELIHSLEWLGLDWDEGATGEMVDGVWKTGDKGSAGPYRQSQRTHIYKKYLQGLLDKNKAYYCYCTKEDLEAERQALMAQGLPAKYGGHCSKLSEAPEGKSAQSIRFRMPEVKVSWKDMIRGEVSFDLSLFGDIVIAKDLDTALYNFAVVVDDHEMAISHVIRGEDHISNTPKQLAIHKALEFKEPQYGHFPLILSADRSKMSKRYAETALINYKHDGYLPEALVNFLALLGWHPTDDREIFTLAELIKEFDIKRVQKAGAIFNPEKLDWINGQYIRALSTDDLLSRLKPFMDERGFKFDSDKVKKILMLEKDRLKTLKDFFEASDFFFALPEYQPEILVWKADNKGKTALILEKIKEILENQGTGSMNKDSLMPALSGLIEENGRGSVLWPLRVAVSGKEGSPDPLAIIEILGKEETLNRLNIAIAKISAL